MMPRISQFNYLKSFVILGEAVVEFQYTAQEEDELTLKVGDVITNVTKTSEGWCEGTLNGRRGMFPDNFVKVICIVVSTFFYFNLGLYLKSIYEALEFIY